jgi:very-short-patch-repair endonuclease
MQKIDSNLPNIPPLKGRRKELRKNPTAAECVLWKHLQRKQLLGRKFRRQYSVGRYVVDFFCVECKVAIELDGAPHYSILHEDYEAERTAFLESQGIEILRFENRMVFENLEVVLEMIREAVRRRCTETISPP